MISYWTSCTYRVHLVTVRIITVLLNKLRTLMISWNYNVQITHLLWAQHNTIFALPAVSDHVLNWLFKPTFSFFFPQRSWTLSLCAVWTCTMLQADWLLPSSLQVFELRQHPSLLIKSVYTDTMSCLGCYYEEYKDYLDTSILYN